MTDRAKIMKPGNRVEILKSPIGESKKLVGRIAVIDSLIWQDTFASITVKKRPRERKVKEIFTMAGNFKKIKG